MEKKLKELKNGKKQILTNLKLTLKNFVLKAKHQEAGLVLQLERQLLNVEEKL
jgi:hypothetical protein